MLSPFHETAGAQPPGRVLSKSGLVDGPRRRLKLRSPPSRSRKTADGKTAQDGTDTTDGVDGAPTKPATNHLKHQIILIISLYHPRS